MQKQNSKNKIIILFSLALLSLLYFIFTFHKTYAQKKMFSVAIVKSQLTAKYMPNPAYYLQEIEYAYKALSNMGLKVATIGDDDIESGSFLKNKYALLILPNVKNMSQKTVLNIKKFARDEKGKILAFYMTSYRNELDEAQNTKQSSHIQNNFQLADIFGADFLRWSNTPPLCQFLTKKTNGKPVSSLWSGVPEKIEIGRNLAMIIKPYNSSKILAVWGNAPGGDTPSFPGKLGAAIVANSDKNCIYVGENLLVPENFSSLEVRNLLANIIRYLTPQITLNTNIAHNLPLIKQNLSSNDYPLHNISIKEFGKKIRIGMTLQSQNITVTASSPFQLLDGNEMPIAMFHKGEAIYVSLSENHLTATVKTLKGRKHYTNSSFIIRPLSPKGLMSYIDFRNNGTYQIKRFRGDLLLLPQKSEESIYSHQIQIINILDINYYIAGVVPHEVPFHFPEEALKAMATVARSFALHSLGRHNNEGFDLCNTVHCQAYDGVSYEAPSSSRAVSDTGNNVIYFNGKIADITYHSTCGGITEDIASVWNTKPVSFLRSVFDAKNTTSLDLTRDESVLSFLSNKTGSFCHLSSRYRWKETYTKTELEELFKESLPVILKRPVSNFSINDIKVMERTSSGRVKRLLIKTSANEYIIPQEKIRWLFSNGKIGLSGLQSTLFVILKENTAKDGNNNDFIIHIIGGGWGHGVGMCQFGARGMAETGAHYNDILIHYFPGVNLSLYQNYR